MCLQKTKNHGKHERKSKISSKTLYQSFVCRQSGNRHLPFVFSLLVCHIFHDGMHLKPYKSHLWHKLEYRNFVKRLNFAHRFLKQSKSIREYIICIDEAYFYLTLFVNNQNNRYWSVSQPYIRTETLLNDQKILVWRAIIL